MSEKRPYPKPELKEGDCVGHVFIDLGHRTEQAFSRQGAEEIVAGAFEKAEISGPDFHRLIDKIQKTPFLKGSKKIHVCDILMDLRRREPQLRTVQKMVMEEEMALI